MKDNSLNDYKNSAVSLSEYNLAHSAFLTNYPDNAAYILNRHLTDPSFLSHHFADAHNQSLHNLKELYYSIRLSREFQKLVSSIFYPRRLMYSFARSTVSDWVADPDYADRILNHEPVFSRVLEVHTTKGSCNYRCAMCLWSDKNELTYKKLNLDSNGLMNFNDWEKVFIEAHHLGVKTLVLSGGGEVLLNSELDKLIECAASIGLQLQLYTNGYSLNKIKNFEAMAKIQQVRFSVHSPLKETYNLIMGMPVKSNSLERISENIKNLISLRLAKKSSQKIGIGFVIQPLNFDQISEMAEFACMLGLDFLNIRKDEVSVTSGLNSKQLSRISEQINKIRINYIKGSYGNMYIDFSDDLTALANGYYQENNSVELCFAKYFRPTISPFGITTPCDLKAEPRFANSDYSFGNIKNQTLSAILPELINKEIKANCTQCMPSGRTGNAIYYKLLQDHKDGIDFHEQPFNWN